MPPQPASLEVRHLGGTLDLVGVAPGGGPLQLTPGGGAHVLDRSGAAMPFALSWQPSAGGLCILLDDVIGNCHSGVIETTSTRYVYPAVQYDGSGVSDFFLESGPARN